MQEGHVCRISSCLVLVCSSDSLIIKKHVAISQPCSSSLYSNWSCGYRLGAESGGECVAYGCEQQRVELLAQAEEVAEGEDDHLFGVSVQPFSNLRQNSLPGEHK